MRRKGLLVIIALGMTVPFVAICIAGPLVHNHSHVGHLCPRQAWQASENSLGIRGVAHTDSSDYCAFCQWDKSTASNFQIVGAFSIGDIALASVPLVLSREFLIAFLFIPSRAPPIC